MAGRAQCKHDTAAKVFWGVIIARQAECKYDTKRKNF